MDWREGVDIASGAAETTVSWGCRGNPLGPGNGAAAELRQVAQARLDQAWVMGSK